MSSTLHNPLQAIAAKRSAFTTRGLTTSSVAAALLGTLSLGAVTESHAIPGFARQTGMACAACHTTFPAINAFGRAFKAGGYTLVGSQPLIEGENLSLPSTLNMSLITKLRYNKTNGDSGSGDDRGAIEWPNEAAFLVGGRVSERIGFLAEIALGGATEVEDNNDGTSSGDTNGLFGLKIPFNVGQVGNTSFSIIPFSTDGLGVAYGFELLNTGALRSQRSVEHRSTLSAAQALEIGVGEATGMAFVAHTPEFYFNYTPWTPGWGGTNMDIGSGFAHYFRGVYMPAIGSWDTGFGFQYLTGDAKPTEDGVVNPLKTDSWVIDAQANGEVGGMPLSLYASYGVADAGAVWNENTGDAKAFAVLAQLGGLLSNKANVFAGYRTKDNGDTADNKDNAFTIGGQYMPAQNVKFELFHVMESGSAIDARDDGRDNRTMLQFFAGF
jgi:hypothetical protein